MSQHARRSRVGVCVWAASAILTAPATAGAFTLKNTTGGQPIRWTAPNVSFVVDASVNTAASGGSKAVADAVHAWSGASGAPVLSSTEGHGKALPAIDGINTVLFAKNYAPAGNALAVTVLSFDSMTGNLVDADVVISGKHAFSVFDAAARAPHGTSLVSTEGTGSASASSSSGDTKGWKTYDDDQGPKFDLVHVATHELGHALGLGDVGDDSAPVMYAYSMPNDASQRSPSSDDLAGLGSLYAASPNAKSGSGGCGASVSASRLTANDTLAIAALMLGATAWLASGQAGRRARRLVPIAGACAIFIGSAAPAQSAAQAAPSGANVTAHVVSVTTRNVDGVFESTLELVPRSCKNPLLCPPRTQAHVWGGTIGGITQQVGDKVAPSVDDEVDLLIGALSGSGANGAGADVTVLSVRPLTPPMH